MKGHILVVDDEPAIRQALCRLFTRAGFGTYQAQNGLEALQVLRREKVDLITMDIAMAQMDGVDAISIVQNDTSIPIVVISAQLDPNTHRDLDRRNIHFRIEKPFTADQVMDTISKALDQTE